MATQFSTLLKLALPTQGELTGSWGDVVNNNITSMVEEAVAGLKTINTWSSNSATLSTANGTTAESRAAILNLTDSTSDLTGAATLICPTLTKVFIVKNSTGEVVTVKTASGSGMAIANGSTSIVFCDGTNVVEAITGITGNLAVGGNLTVAGNATVTGTTTFNGGTLTLGDSAADNVVFGADVNSSIIPNTDDTFDLGSASQEWRNLFLDGTANIDILLADTATIDSVNIDGKVITMTGDTSDTAIFTAGTNGTLTIVTTDAAGAAANITITADGTAELAGTTVTLNSGGDIILDADGANIVFKDGGTAILDIANNSTDVELTVSTADKNFAIKGTDGSSAITALDIDMALAGKATFSGDVVVTGDLTITGDDLVMATNTAGHMLIADGNGFNPIAVTDLTAMTAAASDDVILIVDTSGGGLKKVARSVFIDGLASSDSEDIVNDQTPQLGGNLDLNGNDIITTSNATLDLAPNGTGTVVVRGNSNSGAIVFNCESNSHGQKVFGQPHSASVTNTLMLPAGANSTLVSLVSADTLTNKTLTAPTLTGTATVASLDISGDIDVDGTTNLDVVDIDGAVSITAATTIGTNNKIIFRDAAIHISSTADGDLSIAADDEIDLTSTLIDINGNVEISGTATTTGVHTFTAVPVFPNNTVETADIQADAITGAKIADDAIDSEHYTDASIDTAHIANLQITTGLIAADAITEAKIADNAVESEHVNDNVISGQTALTSGIADADELLISDNGTIKRTDMSVIKTYIGAADDATALAIALG